MLGRRLPLKRIGELYAIEAEIRVSPADERLAGNRAADAIAVRPDTRADEGAVTPLRYSEGVRVPAETVGCAEPVLQ